MEYEAVLDSPARDPEARFWRAFLGLGFGVLVAGSAMTEIYLSTSPDGPHRFGLAVLAAVVGVSGLFALSIVPWVARRAARRWMSVVFTLTSGAIIAVSAWLDGGMSSPLIFLLLIPVMYGGLAFRPVAIAACALASILEIGVIAWTDTGRDERPGTTLLALAGAVGIGVVAWSTAQHRVRLQQRTDELTHDLGVMAATDGLTGCLNQRAFASRVQAEIDRALRYRQPLSLVIADIDHLKWVNDALGHGAGDDALRAAGETLRAGSRASDFLARIGGDEFALLLPGTTIDAAAELARRLFVGTSADAGVVSFSAGVAELDQERPTLEALFHQADTALYHAKRTGRAGVSVLLASGSPVRLDDDVAAPDAPAPA